MTRVDLLEDPMYLALPARAPAGRQRDAAPGGPARDAWVQTSQREPVRAPRRALLPRRRLRANVAFESDDYQTVQGLVAAGVGVALIPELALSVVREDIAIRALSPARRCAR